MRNSRIVALTLLLAWWPAALLAADPQGIGRFSEQIPGTDRQIPIASATLADQVFFRILVSADDGEHLLQVSIYDGKGREVYNAETTLVAKGGRGSHAVSYGFDARRDAPGIWWYVAALDEKVVVSSSLKVSER